MRASFNNYTLSDEQRKLAEQAEGCGIELWGSEEITDEAGFNGLIEIAAQRIRDLGEDQARSLEQSLYDVRTIGPYPPYPSTPRK